MAARNFLAKIVCKRSAGSYLKRDLLSWFSCVKFYIVSDILNAKDVLKEKQEVPEKEIKFLNYIRIIREIEAPGNREERENYELMLPKIAKAFVGFVGENTKYDCNCERLLGEHLDDLKNPDNEKFRNHVLMISNLLQKYPHLAPLFINAACLKLSKTDWSIIQDNADNLKQTPLE